MRVPRTVRWVLLLALLAALTGVLGTEPIPQGIERSFALRWPRMTLALELALVGWGIFTLDPRYRGSLTPGVGRSTGGN